MMVCYVYDCNYVKFIPMKSRSASEWVKAYDTIHQELTVKGFKPKLQTLDNEASAALKNFFTANDVDYQLVPTHCHRRNAAECAIRNFKEHFSIALVVQTLTAGGNHIESPADLETVSSNIRRGSLSWSRGLQQNSFCSAMMQNHCTREIWKATHLGSSRAAWIFLGSRNASLPMSKCIHLGHGQ
jgi:hypothetical protein